MHYGSYALEGPWLGDVVPPNHVGDPTLQIIASWVIAVPLLLALVTLLLAGTALTFGNDSGRARRFAARYIVWIFVLTIVLAIVAGVFQWFVNFKFVA